MPNTSLINRPSGSGGVSLPYQFAGYWIRQWQQRRAREEKLRQVQERAAAFNVGSGVGDMAFTFAVIGLGAKLCIHAGKVHEEALIVFRQTFPMPTSEQAKLRQLFLMAAKDGADMLHHARRIARFFPAEKHVVLLRDVLQRLLRVAAVEGVTTPDTMRQLRAIAKEFGVSRWEFGRMARLWNAPRQADPYAVLGVLPSWSDADIRRAYHQLMREYHPDRVQAQGGGTEAVHAAQRHVAAINAAYTAIRVTRRGSDAA